MEYPVFYYYHADHLGSSSVMTNRDGDVVQHYTYKAFGYEQFTYSSTSYNVTNRYTGQELDEDTGLYYYGSRYYDPEIGRFIQADSIVPGTDSSQNFNRYSYCVNNPLKYIDPSGYLNVPAVIGAITQALTSEFIKGASFLLGFGRSGFNYCSPTISGGAAALINAATGSTSNMGLPFGINSSLTSILGKPYKCDIINSAFDLHGIDSMYSNYDFVDPTHYSPSFEKPGAMPLIKWYFSGRGGTFRNLPPDGWSDLIMSYPEPTRTFLMGYICDLASGTENYGIVDAHFPFTFDPRSGKAERYLHGGQMYLKGYWHRLNDPHRIVFTNVYYSFHDTGDLHPGKGYWRDIVGTGLVSVNNLFRSKENEARKYPIELSTPLINTIFYLHPNNSIRKIEGWPGPWPGNN